MRCIRWAIKRGIAFAIELPVARRARKGEEAFECEVAIIMRDAGSEDLGPALFDLVTMRAFDFEEAGLDLLGGDVGMAEEWFRLLRES